MATPEEIREVRQKLEAALQDYVRLTREDVGNVFVQDYVIAVASESMDPGYENTTLFNHLNRPSMALYSVVGLLDSATGYYKRVGGGGQVGG
jgi:hypothetical protein